MFYLETLKKLYASIKSDNSIDAGDKKEALELINKLVKILALY